MIKIVINSELGPLTFIGRINRADAPEELSLSVRWFYKRWRKTKDIPSFPHHEVELVNMNDFKKLSRGLKLHIHKSIKAKGKRKFMCYVPDVPTPEAAQLMFKAWCVGTVYSFIKGKTTRDPKLYDFAYPFVECNQDQQKFIDFMAENHNIIIRK